MSASITHEQIETLRRYDTCTVANAIDSLGLRLRNEGYTDSSIRCFTPKPAPMVGHAVTLRVRCSNPQPVGSVYHHRTDWWQHFLSVPTPRVIVIQDMDANAGSGAFPGEVQASIWRAMGCVGAVTNGAVHDLPAIEKMDFHVFAHGISVSHAYAHIVGFGEAVEVGGLKINPGDLLHADVHGVLSVPPAAVAKIPGVADKLLRREREILDLCATPGITLEAILERVQRSND